MSMNEHRVHQIFLVSVLLKGAHALIECLGGTILALVSTTSIVNFVNAITLNELIEEAEAVRTIFARYLELGSMRPLIEDLDRRGIRTKANGRPDGRQRGGIQF